MPFYLAIPRKSGAGSGAGSGRSQFQRTSPSRLVLTLMSAPVTWPSSILIGDLGFLAYSRFLASESGRQVVSSVNRRAFFPDVNLRDSIPIHFPDLMIRFVGAVPDGVQTRVEEMGGTLERFPQLDNKDAYLIRNPTGANFREALTFPNVDGKARPPFDAVTPDGAMALFTIVTRITAGAVLTNVIFGVENGTTKEVMIYADSDSETLSDNTLRPPLPKAGDGDDDEEGQMEEGEVEHEEEEETTDWDCPQGSFYKLFVDTPSPVQVFGNASDIPLGPGMFMPYEPNYSQPDEGAINLFLSRFYRISVQQVEDLDKELDDLMRYWVVEIANTKMGQYLAHMITVLDLALKGGLGVYFIFRDDATYEGAILRGTFSLKQVGNSVVDSCSATDLVTEVANYGFHSTSVREIVQMIDEDLDARTVTTLRALRGIVMDQGMPSGQRRNRIEKLLQSVSFNERPMTLTLPSFETVFNLLSSPGIDIPGSLYLHRNDFFSEMRVQLILSAFGDRVPCLSYGGATRLRASRKIGKGTSDIQPRANDPPSTFQFKSIAMAGALPLWNAMMQTGILSTDVSTRIQGSRVLTGPTKGKMWASVADFLDKTVIEKGTIPVVPDRRIGDEGQKRKQTDDSAEDRKKRMRSFF